MIFDPSSLFHSTITENSAIPWVMTKLVSIGDTGVAEENANANTNY